MRRQGFEPRTHCLRGSRSTVELAARESRRTAEAGRFELPTEDVSCYGLAVRCLTTRPNLHGFPPSPRRQVPAPRTGIEPATSRSTGARSPTELTGHRSAYPERDSNAQPHRSERCASAFGPPGHVFAIRCERRTRTSNLPVQSRTCCRLHQLARGSPGRQVPRGTHRPGVSAGTSPPRWEPSERFAGACVPRTESGHPCAGCSRRRRPRC